MSEWANGQIWRLRNLSELLNEKTISDLFFTFVRSKEELEWDLIPLFERSKKKMKDLLVCLTIVSLTLCLYVVAQAKVDPSLVLYFDFEGVQGDTVKDLSSYGNDGTIQGKPNLVDGQFGKGLELDGGSFIIVSDCDEFKITKEVTLASWQKFKSVDANYNFLVCRWAWAKGSNRCYETYLLKGAPAMVVSSDGTDATASPAVAKEAVKLDKWYNIVGVFDGSEVKVYVDGEESASVKHGGGKIVAGVGPISIGDNNEGIAPDYRFVGAIDEVAVYNRALNQNEIKQKMMSGHTLAVRVEGKLTTTWGVIKAKY